MAATDAPMVGALDNMRLTRRYWAMLVIVILSTMADFFDFFMVGFVLAILAKPWQLTFGQIAFVFLSSGAGAIVGSFLWGWVGDRWGRKPAFIASICTFSMATAILAATPERAWVFFVAFRFAVGLGQAGVVTINIPLMVEYTPTRWRTQLAGYASVGLIPMGVLLASLLAAFLTGALGWRGLFAVGASPVILAPLVVWLIPESPRWLLSRGRAVEARKAISVMSSIPEDDLPLDPPRAAPTTQQTGSYADLLRYRREFWLTVLVWFAAAATGYGITSWGPTLLSQLLRITPAEAAFLFIFVSVAGIAGRAAFSVLPAYLGGRRVAGLLMGLAGCAVCVVAAFTHSTLIGGLSLFWMALMAANFFVDGGWTNVAPFPPEIFPGHLRGRAAGLGQMANGVGKIVGPVGLALIAGSTNFVNPAASASAATPAFLYLGGLELLAALAYLFLKVEPHGRTLERIEGELLERPDVASKPEVAG